LLDPIKKNEMGGVWGVGRVAYKVLVGRRERKRPLEVPRN